MGVSGLFTKRPRALAFLVLTVVLAFAASGDVVSSPASADLVSTPGKVTAGGLIDPITGTPVGLATMLIQTGSNATCVGGKATLGFVVQFKMGDAAPTGNLTYIGCNLDVKATSFSLLAISGRHATLAGKGTINGASNKDFQVDVDDDCQFQSGDQFNVQTEGGNTASGPLTGGDIEVCPQIPINHIVVLMQENRSFDHYFGHLRQFDPTLDVGAEPADASNPDPTNPIGTPIQAFHRSENLPPGWAKFCEVADLDHSWNGTHREWNNGNMDGFTKQNVFNNPIPGGPTDPKGSRAMGFYNQTDLPFYYGLYDTFAMGDRYFASVLSQTFPNRFYLLAGTSWVDTSQQFAETVNRIPGASSAPADQMKGRSIFNLLDEANPPISWKVYNAEPVLAFANEFAYVRSHPEKVVPITSYFADAVAGTLPQVAFVDPIFVGPKNVENDEHPPANIQVGQDFVARVINALMASPEWSSSALFLAYDEHGGYFDHVPPPAATPPDNHLPPNFNVPGGNLPPAFDRYGIRVPVVVVSPFSKKHFVSHVVHDHTSILRFIETRFGLPALTKRDAAADPMLEFFDFSNPPFVIPPALPAATIDATGFRQCQLLETTTPPPTP